MINIIPCFYHNETVDQIFSNTFSLLFIYLFTWVNETASLPRILGVQLLGVSNHVQLVNILLICMLVYISK